MCIFFGRKIKGRKIKKMHFSAPKTKKKTKFGRPLLWSYTSYCQANISVGANHPDSRVILATWHYVRCFVAVLLQPCPACCRWRSRDQLFHIIPPLQSRFLSLQHYVCSGIWGLITQRVHSIVTERTSLYRLILPTVVSRGISVLNHSLFNTHLSHSRQWFNRLTHTCWVPIK